MTKEYHCDNCKAWRIEIGDIIEIDYQTNVAYVKGFSSEKAQDGKRFIYIHSEVDSQKREWLEVARQRLRLVERVRREENG